MTARTIEYPDIQGHLLPMSTLATCLTRIGGVHLRELSTSFFRFARQFAEKFRPRGIYNAFRQTMIVNHPVHVQVFDADDTKSINDLAAFLMGEVITPEPNTFMHPRYNLTMLPTLRCAFNQFGVFTLDFGKGFLFLAEEAGIVDFFFVAESSECLQANIDTHLSWSRVKAKRLALTREGNVPFACRGTLHGTGFHLAFDLAMIDHLDGANLGEAYPFIMCDAKAALREGEAIVSAFAFETGKPRLLGMFSHSTEERFEGQINANGYVLQDLGMHSGEGRTFLFQNRERILLLKTGEGNTIPFIGRLTHFQQVVIEPTALFKGFVQLLFLLLSGKDAVLKHFQHIVIVAQTEQGCKRGTAPPLPRIRNAPSIPVAEALTFTHIFGKSLDKGITKAEVIPISTMAIVLPGSFIKSVCKMWVKDRAQARGFTARVGKLGRR